MLFLKPLAANLISHIFSLHQHDRPGLETVHVKTILTDDYFIHKMARLSVISSTNKTRLQLWFAPLSYL